MKCRAARRFKRRIGRRGTILSCYGLVWILYGYGQLTAPQPDQRGLRAALSLMPLSAWGWCWIAAGIVALVSAWAPPGRDAAAFIVLPLIVVPWMASYLAAWVTGGYPRGWVAAAVWAVITVPVLVAAGWPEPPRAKKAEPPYEC
jgi:hypothetical protein